jgi:hypothetical protein
MCGAVTLSRDSLDYCSESSTYDLANIFEFAS